MGEIEPNVPQSHPTEGTDIFSGKNSVSLSEVRDSFGFEPGSPEYLHVSTWLQLEMGEALQSAEATDFSSQIGINKARALHSSVQESLDAIHDSLDLTPDEEKIVISFSPHTTVPQERTQTKDENVPLQQTTFVENDLTVNEEAIVTSDQPEPAEITADDLFGRSGLQRSLHNKMKLRNTARRMGFTFVGDVYQIPPQMLDLFLNTINPERTDHTKKKK